MDIEYNPDNLPSTETASAWTPVLDGDIYCSPGCGSRCKKADYDMAVREANRLSETLGDGWEPEVWENGGWYYEICRGGARVSLLGNGEYVATCQVDGPQESITLRYRHVDPRRAVQDMVQAMTGMIARLTRARDSLAAALPVREVSLDDKLREEDDHEPR